MPNRHAESDTNMHDIVWAEKILRVEEILQIVIINVLS